MGRETDDSSQAGEEILSGKTENPHIAEERGQTSNSAVADEDLDEEDKYSGVRRKGSATNAYVPPALRRLTSGGSSEAGPAKDTTKGGNEPVASKAPEAKSKPKRLPQYLRSQSTKGKRKSRTVEPLKALDLASRPTISRETFRVSLNTRKPNFKSKGRLCRTLPRLRENES